MIANGATLDLHLHSIRSDGQHSPAKLQAMTADLDVIAITDHDVITPIPTGESTRGRPRQIAGIEVTAAVAGREVHCLGYLFDTSDSTFADRVATYRHAILDAWHTMLEAATITTGCTATWSDFETTFGHDRVPYSGLGLWFLINHLPQDSPAAPDAAQGLERFVAEWCTPGRPLHVPEPTPPDLVEVIGWIRDAGGAPVLAHPLTALRLDQLRVELPRLQQAGLAGIEVVSTWNPTDQERELLTDLAAQLGLVATGGSDFHGTEVKPWVRKPGIHLGTVPTAFELVDQLKRAACGPLQR